MRRYIREDIYRSIMADDHGVVGVKPQILPEPKPEPRPADIASDGWLYDDLSCADGRLIAVLTNRPLELTLGGDRVRIPDAWIYQARVDYAVCPACVGSERDMRRICDHGIPKGAL